MENTAETDRQTEKTYSNVSASVGEALGVGRHDAPSVPSKIREKFEQQVVYGQRSSF